MVFDLNKTALNLATSRGARVSSSPRGLAEQVDVVISMLPSYFSRNFFFYILHRSPHVKSVYCGTDGVFKGIQKGALLIDSSTIDPGTARYVAQVMRIIYAVYPAL